jgi:hypothetical protein
VDLIAAIILVSLQDEGKQVRLPEMPAYRLEDGRYLVASMRVGKDHFEFLKDLRRVPAIESRGIPSQTVIEKHLQRKAASFDSALCYVESDWMKPEDLSTEGALVHRTSAAFRDLVGVTGDARVCHVVVREREDYFRLVDGWSTLEREKKEARHFASIFVGDHRVGHEDRIEEAWSIAVGDTARLSVGNGFRRQTAFNEALGVYFEAFLVGTLTCYVSGGVTTPRGRRLGSVEDLVHAARGHFGRRQREGLDFILKSELNAMTLERLSAAFALVDYLLRTKRDRWREFHRLVDERSMEAGKVKGPEGRFEALVSALREAMEIEWEGLEARLGEFVAGNYLYPEDVARLVKVDQDCAGSAFAGYLRMCELKREGKGISEKGERIWMQIQDRVRRKLEAFREHF